MLEGTYCGMCHDALWKYKGMILKIYFPGLWFICQRCLYLNVFTVGQEWRSFHPSDPLLHLHLHLSSLVLGFGLFPLQPGRTETSPIVRIWMTRACASRWNTHPVAFSQLGSCQSCSQTASSSSSTSVGWRRGLGGRAPRRRWWGSGRARCRGGRRDRRRRGSRRGGWWWW